MTDEIRLRGLRAYGHHGVFEHERQKGQEFIVDVDVRVPLGNLADDIDGTIHYGMLAQAIVDAVERDPVDLIETVAERIAAPRQAGESSAAYHFHEKNWGGQSMMPDTENDTGMRKSAGSTRNRTSAKTTIHAHACQNLSMPGIRPAGMDTQSHARQTSLLRWRWPVSSALAVGRAWLTRARPISVSIPKART